MTEEVYFKGSVALCRSFVKQKRNAFFVSTGMVLSVVQLLNQLWEEAMNTIQKKRNRVI